MSKIQIRKGREGGDCTAPYYVTIQKPTTVGEFIEEWMKDEREWGYFGICNKSEPFFGSPVCEYWHGKIKGEPLPKEILKSNIDEVMGCGGWSRSDFQFKLEG